MLDFDYADAGRSDGNDIDLVGLEAVRCGKGEIGQQDPLAIAGVTDETGLETGERHAFALVDGRPAGNDGDFHHLPAVATASGELAITNRRGVHKRTTSRTIQFNFSGERVRGALCPRVTCSDEADHFPHLDQGHFPTVTVRRFPNRCIARSIVAALVAWSGFNIRLTSLSATSSSRANRRCDMPVSRNAS